MNSKLLTTDEYKKLIKDVLDSEGIVVKNHDYFSRIRGTIRGITDSKAEYEALRDDILGAYDKRKNGRSYSVRYSDVQGQRFGKNPTDEVDNIELQKDYFDLNHELPYGRKIFSAGVTKDFDKKEASFFTDHIKEMDGQGIKYFWSLGKDGLMITKFNANSNEEMPRNENGHYDSNPRIHRAMENQYDQYHDRRIKDTDYMNAIKESVHKHGTGEISFKESWDMEREADYKFQRVNAKECIDELDACLKNEGLYNQVTDEPLFQFSYIRTGHNKEINQWR